jgi:hypothetical protein
MTVTLPLKYIERYNIYLEKQIVVLVKRKPRLFDLDGNDVTEEYRDILPNNGEGSIIEVEEDEMVEGDEVIVS